jgi:hypothetical protein
MAIVGLLAFLIAWNVVGKLYSYDIIEGGFIGSAIHWAIRFVVFVVIWFIFAIIIRVINWILKVPTYVWAFLGGAVVIIGIVFVVVKIVSWRKSLIK